MNSRVSQTTQLKRESQIGLISVAIGLCLLKKEITIRRWWERPHLGVENRLIYGQENLLNQMRVSDVDSFVSLIRLRPETFDKLLSIVGPLITRNSSRPPINPSTRLAVTLRYLATGESAKSLSYSYRLGISTTGDIIKETLGAIYNELQPLVLPVPTTQKWLEISDGFQRRWNIPHCCGSVDGKHIRTTKPDKSGSDFYNYKDYFSTVLMAICDHEYKFVAVDTGCQGRNNDVVVLNNSEIGKQMMDLSFNLPGETEIKFGPKLPHYFVADGIFGLRPYLMVPYPGRGTGKLSYTQKIFNYRQARGRRVVENSFGIFANVWGIFHTAINAPPVVLDRIVMAAVCLHNFRIMENENNDFVPRDRRGNLLLDLDSVEESPLYGTGTGTGTSSNEEARAHRIRDDLADYFISGGQVYWQDSLID